MPSPYTSAQNTAVVESNPELEYVSETEPESNPDREASEEYVIQNQLGLPDYQFGTYVSSPPRGPVDANVNCDKLNNEGELFSQRKICEAECSVRRSSLQSRSQCR